MLAFPPQRKEMKGLIHLKWILTRTIFKELEKFSLVGMHAIKTYNPWKITYIVNLINDQNFL